MTLRTLAPVLLLLGLAAPAAAQTAVKLEGTCEKLVIAGQDLSDSCKGVLTNTVARNLTSFDFAAEDGQTLSFGGSGAQQERTEETDPLQPISRVVPGKGGAAQGPVLAVGACRFSTPEPGKTAITCEATAPGQNATYAGTFVTQARTTAAAPEGSAASGAAK
ncbi:hypothetical protein [Methylobacterium radiodurans]